MLVRGGFIRQTHAGMFQFLPLGLRILEKLERLLDKHMTKLGASKVSLSTFSSEDLWRRSGRLSGDRSELWSLEDRKGMKFLLSPTHEEEITSLVADAVHSYKDLPLRLYQITRKYRDERRPRQGLLRTREFLMKDLYTFDATKDAALQTYETVRKAYEAFFDEFKIEYSTAEADSGSIGGDLSHEYHILSSKGEDRVISCTSCSYTANEEVARSGRMKLLSSISPLVRDPGISLENGFQPLLDGREDLRTFSGISRDRKTLYQAVIPTQVLYGPMNETRATRMNLNAVRSVFGDIDLSVGDGRNGGSALAAPAAKWKYALDYRLSQEFIKSWNDLLASDTSNHNNPIMVADLVEIETGDQCSNCGSGTLIVQSAVELGHTFYLGTKYSEPLGARVLSEVVPLKTQTMTPVGSSDSKLETANATMTPMEMGCHGIGVSRMIAAIADSLADERGLNWPRAMAPFEVVVIPARGNEQDAEGVMDLLTNAQRDSQPPLASQISQSIDAILDDRAKEIGWKLKDADLIGYPIIVVLGRSWKKEKQMCEIQCRRLGVKEYVLVEDLKSSTEFLLAQL
ncbi:hypothetical protein MMC19_001067 [Ptychographa xylographoides]|nr:hypothetical protein [Ptychographa xylographoides]